MGGEFNMYRGEERCIEGLMGKPEGKRPLEYSGVDERIILR